MVSKAAKVRAALLAAIVCAGVWLAWPNLAGLVQGFWPNDSEDQIPVLVADHYLGSFQTLKRGDVRVKNYPKEFIPPGALHRPQQLTDDAGRPLYQAIVAIPEGQPITETLLSAMAKERGMASLLQSGRVAVSFAVDASHAAGGWVQPGDTIALFSGSRLLLSAVQVLAVDKKHLGASDDAVTKTAEALTDLAALDTGTHVLTIVAAPAQAAQVIGAQALGPLQVVLRAPGDDLPWPGAKP